MNILRITQRLRFGKDYNFVHWKFVNYTVNTIICLKLNCIRVCAGLLHANSPISMKHSQ